MPQRNIQNNIVLGGGFILFFILYFIHLEQISLGVLHLENTIKNINWIWLTRSHSLGCPAYSHPLTRARRGLLRLKVVSGVLWGLLLRGDHVNDQAVLQSTYATHVYQAKQWLSLSVQFKRKAELLVSIVRQPHKLWKNKKRRHRFQVNDLVQINREHDFIFLKITFVCLIANMLSSDCFLK